MDRGLRLLRFFFVNVPYELLKDKYWDLFVSYRISPEIYFSPSLLDRWPEAEWKEMAQSLRELGMKATFHAPFYDLSPGALDEKIRQATLERLVQVLELASIFHPQAIVAHLGFDPRIHESYEEEWLENSLKTWQAIIPLLKKVGTFLNLENVFENTPELFKKLLSKINSPYIGICFDYGHTKAFTNTGLRNWQEIFPWVRQLHLHDNQGQKDDHWGLGKGILGFSALFSKLKQYNCYPIITLEPHTEAAFWDTLDYLNRLPEDIYAYLEKCGQINGQIL